MSSYTPINNQGGQASNAPPAPNAPRPGMGRGNVPFAPGVMSGNLGQGNNPTPLARQSGPPPQQPQQSAPPPRQPGQAPPPGGPPGGGASGPGAGMQTPNTQAIAAFYLNFLESYLLAIKESVNKPLVGGQY